MPYVLESTEDPTLSSSIPFAAPWSDSHTRSLRPGPLSQYLPLHYMIPCWRAQEGRIYLLTGDVKDYHLKL